LHPTADAKYFVGFAKDVFKEKPFHKAVGVFGGGPLVTIAEFVLKLLGVNLGILGYIKILISKGIGYLLIHMLDEAGKKEYGIKTGRIFKYPRHVKYSPKYPDGRKIVYYYVFLLLIASLPAILTAMCQTILNIM